MSQIVVANPQSLARGDTASYKQKGGGFVCVVLHHLPWLDKVLPLKGKGKLGGKYTFWLSTKVSRSSWIAAPFDSEQFPVERVSTPTIMDCFHFRKD